MERISPTENRSSMVTARTLFLGAAMSMPFAGDIQRVLSQEPAKAERTEKASVLPQKIRSLLLKHGEITEHAHNPEGKHVVICLSQLHAIPCDALKETPVVEALHAHHEHMLRCLEELEAAYPEQSSRFILESLPPKSFRTNRRADFLRGVDHFADNHKKLAEATKEGTQAIFNKISLSPDPYRESLILDAGNRFAARTMKQGKEDILEGDLLDQSAASMVNFDLYSLSRKAEPDLSDAELTKLLEKWTAEEREILTKRHVRYRELVTEHASSGKAAMTSIVLGLRHFTEKETEAAFFGRPMTKEEKDIFLIQNILRSIPGVEVVVVLPKGWKEYDDLMQKFFKNPPKDRPAGFMKPIPALTPQDVRDMVEHMRNHKQGACRYQGMAYIC